VTSVSFDELVQQLIDHRVDVTLLEILDKLDAYGVEIRGPYRAYYPVDSYFILDRLSRRAGAIIHRLVEDERLEVVSFVGGHGDRVINPGAFELDEPRRREGQVAEFTTSAPSPGKADREVRVRIRPKPNPSNPRGRLSEEQGDDTRTRVFVERSLTEERDDRAQGSMTTTALDCSEDRGAAFRGSAAT
jgi:hypothetical protein